MTSPTAQFVLSLGLDGRVASQGSVSEAIAKGVKIKEEIAEEKAAIEKSEQEVDSDAPKTEKKPDGKLTVAEEIAEGHVSWSASKSTDLPSLRYGAHLRFSCFVFVQSWRSYILDSVLERCLVM